MLSIWSPVQSVTCTMLVKPVEHLENESMNIDHQFKKMDSQRQCHVTFKVMDTDT